ncbi:hypothetical protein [Haloplanus salilacus]|uniref:hypothetical protein n=1 Tax=Haloplanus salilacus TaxID=2949994 RepID=UPI0030D06639
MDVSRMTPTGPLVGDDGGVMGPHRGYHSDASTPRTGRDDEGSLSVRDANDGSTVADLERCVASSGATLAAPTRPTDDPRISPPLRSIDTLPSTDTEAHSDG